jgi:hypothetical protein
MVALAAAIGIYDSFQAARADFETPKSFVICLWVTPSCRANAITSRLNSSVYFRGMISILPHHPVMQSRSQPNLQQSQMSGGMYYRPAVINDQTRET